MLEFFVSYPPEGADELPELVPDLVALGLPLLKHLKQGPDLVVVVLSDLGLDSLGACHGGLAAHERRGPAEPRRHHGPERVQGGRAHAVLRDQRVERLEVAGLLFVHVRHQRPEVRVCAHERRRLGRVDERRC